jgi:hypothetical protein
MKNKKLNFALIGIVLVIGIVAFALSQNNNSDKITGNMVKVSRLNL